MPDPPPGNSLLILTAGDIKMTTGKKAICLLDLHPEFSESKTGIAK